MVGKVSKGQKKISSFHKKLRKTNINDKVYGITLFYIFYSKPKKNQNMGTCSTTFSGSITNKSELPIEYSVYSAMDIHGDFK
jgi:hypothetical protein